MKKDFTFGDSVLSKRRRECGRGIFVQGREEGRLLQHVVHEMRLLPDDLMGSLYWMPSGHWAGRGSYWPPHGHTLGSWQQGNRQKPLRILT